jgi:hypothetical protein
MGGTCSTYGGEGGLYRGFVGKLRERDHLEEPCVDGKIILRWIFWKLDERAWTGSSCFRIGTAGGHLLMR